MVHERATWRGSNPNSPRVDVCRHMLPKLDLWAERVGAAILLKALEGCGSYQTTTTASAGTHAFGGAIDIDTRALTPAQRVRVETEGRRLNLLVWHRDRIPGVWTFHAHALDPSCRRLAANAKAQFELFRDKRNGLADDGPDRGDREFAARILKEYDRVKAGKTRLGIAAIGARPNFRFPYQPGFPVPGEPGSMYGRRTAGEPIYSGTVALDPTRFVREGSMASGFLAPVWIRGHIKRIQRCLQQVDDGRYEDETHKAVKEFQRTHGLVVDGRVGPQTWRELAASRGQ